jgi:hypothetical protein
VPDVNDLLDEERERPRRTSTRARVALIVAGAATVVALGTGATLAATAAATLVSHEAESSIADELPSRPEAASVPESPPAPATATASDPHENVVEPTPSAPPAHAVQGASGIPFFDASTDIATIPRPVDDPDPANTEIWLAQHGIIADCMLEKGFEYRFTVYWLIPPEATREERLAAFSGAQIGTAEFEALYGVSEFGPDDPAVAPEYRWEDAGCHGYAVHVTGMDDAN